MKSKSSSDRVLPLFEERGIRLLRILTDRGIVFCGTPERHESELYLAVENIDLYRVAFRKKLCPSLEELQADLDLFLEE